MSCCPVTSSVWPAQPEHARSPPPDTSSCGGEEGEEGPDHILYMEPHISALDQHHDQHHDQLSNCGMKMIIHRLLLCFNQWMIFIFHDVAVIFLQGAGLTCRGTWAPSDKTPTTISCPHPKVPIGCSPKPSPFQFSTNNGTCLCQLESHWLCAASKQKIMCTNSIVNKYS